MNNKLYGALLSLGLICFAPADLAAGKAKHVVIVVMDGMRPDSVTEKEMPTLSNMKKAGTTFNAHHPVFPSTTEVNGAALSTGMLPANSGVIGNKEYRPELDLLRPLDTQGQWTIWSNEMKNQKPWLPPTLPEIARANGLKTAVAGTKGVTLLWDSSIKDRNNAPIAYEGKTIPSSLLDTLVPDLGPFPPSVSSYYFPNERQDNWTANVMLDKFWANGVPNLSVLWLSEPDYSQHSNGPGQDVPRKALKGNDDILAKILGALEKKGVKDQTDIFVVSDHGFSTVEEKMDSAIYKSGMATNYFIEDPKKDDILMLSQGSVIFIYALGHNEANIKGTLKYIQDKCDWAGVIFTADGRDGTNKFSDVGLNSPSAPDIIVSMKWSDKTYKGFLPGAVIADGMDPGTGMHGSLSRFDMHNTLIAMGPDFKKGYVDQFPSNSADLAPTVVEILGLKTTRPMDGRPLSEAFIDSAEPKESPKTEILKGFRTSGGSWRQYIKITTYQNRRYLDEGNSGIPE